jgi:hypothetical protein
MENYESSCLSFTQSLVQGIKIKPKIRTLRVKVDSDITESVVFLNPISMFPDELLLHAQAYSDYFRNKSINNNY